MLFILERVSIEPFESFVGYHCCYIHLLLGRMKFLCRVARQGFVPQFPSLSLAQTTIRILVLPLAKFIELSRTQRNKSNK